MTTFTGTIPTIASGDTTTVPTNLATYRDALKAASEAWTPYTPTWTAVTVNPAIGNGTLNGKWARINKLVHYRIQLTMGSTTTFGTGAYLFALPTATHADYTAGMHMGAGLALDAGAGWYVLQAGWNTSTQVYVISGTSIATQVGTAVPMTWANGDKLTITGTYESA